MSATPWEFSKEPEDPTTAPLRERSPEGAEMGRHIARFADAAEADQRKRFPNMLPRCDDCAARLGTLPNQNAETLMDFVKCTVENVPFYCHKGVKDGEHPKRLCSGFMVLQGDQQARSVLECFAGVVTAVEEGPGAATVSWTIYVARGGRWELYESPPLVTGDIIRTVILPKLAEKHGVAKAVRADGLEEQCVYRGRGWHRVTRQAPSVGGAS